MILPPSLFSITGTATNADYEVMTQGSFLVIEFNPGTGTGTIVIDASTLVSHIPIRILADSIRESGENTHRHDHRNT